MNKMINNLPSSLTFFELTNVTMEFGNLYISSLPPNLLHLHILDPQCKIQFSSLPPSLKYFTSPHWIDHPVSFLSLSHLTFLYNFNSPVIHLPSSLKRLHFGGQFNQSINNLPPSLTHVTLGYSFNHPIDYLPSSLLHLEIDSSSFNHPINWLPISLF